MSGRRTSDANGPPRFARARLGLVLALTTTGASLASPASAVTTLTVDLSAPTGPVTHAASGSLYGVTETLPADVAGLIAPLRPKMFNNPAADVQQPVGDAIVVAGRVAPTGASVTIRLADWLTGFYTFTNMTDWLDKVGQTVSRKQAAGLTNIYAYEIWNEPNGTWSSSNPLSFDAFWQQTYARLRQLDPGEKITGPSASFYDQNFISAFLSFCKTNGCLPDIVGWHELTGADLASDLRNYRALEKQLGIGPLSISINEYSGAGHINVEGQPGASAPIIAKFERFGVDSACISFWDVGHPGRLGSLLATNTDPNGGWWFYKWYGDMTGEMVTTTPANGASAVALDGFANLDATTGSASALFGGTNDGTIQIIVKGFQSAPALGSKVHAVVEHTPFVNRTTIVKAPDTISTADLTVAGDQVTVSVPGANATDGYRLVLTAVGASGQSSSGASSTASSSGYDGGAAASTSSVGGSTSAVSASSGAGSTPSNGGNSAAWSGRSGSSVSGLGPSHGEAPGASSSGCGCMAAGRSGGPGLGWIVGLAGVGFLAFQRRRRSMRG